MGKGLVLVVDDEAASRQTLCDLLKHGGFDTVAAADGEAALHLLDERQPDAVLLDLMMPGVDGFDVCRRIRENPATAGIPVLIVTSLTDRPARLRAIRLGANDFIIKPFDPDEVLLRVGGAVSNSTLARQVREDSQRIRELEAVRNELTSQIVAGLRTPLQGLTGLLELAGQAVGQRLSGDATGYLQQALGAADTLQELVDSLMDVRQLKANERPLVLEPGDLHLLAGEVAESLRGAATEAQVQLAVAGPPAPLDCDRDLMRRVIRHLARQALLRSPVHAQVALATGSDDTGVWITVTDAGAAADNGGVNSPGAAVPPAGLRVSDPGLSLTFARLAVEAHGGTLAAEASAGANVYRLAFPRKPESTVAAGVPPAPVAAAGRQGRGRALVEAGPKPAAVSLGSRGTRVQFGVAVALLSVIPLLAFAYVLAEGLRAEALGGEALTVITPLVVALVALGVGLLRRHLVDFGRLRRHLEMMVQGGVPETVRLLQAGDDFAVIEKCLSVMMRQTESRIRTIEQQTQALVRAEQHRVMIESLGTVCHHIGQPATVIRVYLEMMRRREATPEMQAMIAECQDAAEAVADILQKLQGVAAYQPEPYLAATVFGQPGSGDRILRI